MKKTKSSVMSFAFPLDLQFFAESTLQDLLQARAEKIERQGAILAAAKAENNRDLTDEEDQEFESLESEITELDGKIEARKKKDQRESTVAARSEALQQPNGNPYRPSAVFGGNPTQPQAKDDGGFKNLGELIHAIRFGDPKGRLHELPVGQGEGGGYGVPDAFKSQILPSRVHAQWTMGNDAEGGAAVFQQFRPEVLMIKPPASIVRPRAMVIPAGNPPDSQITMPALDQGSNGYYGGVQVQWINEGDEKPDTTGKMREVILQPYEVAATTVVTDKLLRNWEAADTFINNLLLSAMAAAEDIAFLTGNGVGKPTGVLGAVGGLSVNRATANKITYADVINMLGVLLPESAASTAVWVANQSALPQIASLQDGAGRFIFIQGDATKGIPSTLAGIPIVFTGKTPGLGAKGDLMLLDLSHYLVKDGSGPFIAASEHVLFKQNKTVIKVFWNVDGKPWCIQPLTLENGVTKVSPYVSLDVPVA